MLHLLESTKLSPVETCDVIKGHKYFSQMGAFVYIPMQTCGRFMAAGTSNQYCPLLLALTYCANSCHVPYANRTSKQEARCNFNGVH